MRLLLATFVTATLGAALSVLAQPATPLADRVPAGSIAYVGWAGGEALGESYAGTRTEALLAASAIPEVVTEYLPELLEALAREEREARPLVDFANKAGPILWRRPHALAFGGVDWTSAQNNGDPMPRLMLVVDAGNESAELRAAVNELFRAIDKPFLSTLVREQDGLVYASVGYTDLELAAAGEGIGAEEGFTTAMAALPGGFDHGTALVAYLDVPKLMQIGIDGTRMEQGDDAVESFTQLVEALGVGNLRRISFAAGFDGRDFAYSSFVGISGERRGVLRLLPEIGDGLDGDLLAAVPDDATAVAAARVQLSQIVPAMRDLVQALSQGESDAPDQFEQGLRYANMFAGADIENDLLGGFGPTWTAYVSPSVGSDLIGGVALNKPADADALKRAMRGMSLNVTNLGNAQLRQETDGKINIPARSFTQNGIEHYVLNAPGLAPTWAIGDGTLTLGLLPQSVMAAHATAGGFGEGEAAQAALNLAGENRPIAMSYADLPATASAKYPSILLVSQLGFGAGDLFGDYLRTRPPLVVLPPLPTVMEELSPAYSVSWQDESGVSTRGVMPFPGANLLVDFGHVGTLLTAVNPATSVGTILPALTRARENARRAQSMNHLRQLGVGLLMYANEHEGQLPPTLSALFPETIPSTDVFFSPRSTRPHPEVMAQAIETQRQVIDAQGDYVYAAGGMKATAMEPSHATPVAWEDPRFHQAGISILYGDGHVEYVSYPLAYERINAAPANGGHGDGM